MSYKSYEKIKNFSTTISVEKTIAEIEKMLSKYGATKIMKEYDEFGNPSRLIFAIVTEHGEMPVKLPVNVDKILEGILKFRETFRGELVTESMLIQDLNDSGQELERIAVFLAKLNPDKSYLATPTRPPFQRTIKAANETKINMAYQIFKDKLSDVEYLTSYEGNDFAFTGNIVDELLGTASVHPIREEGVIALLKKALLFMRSVMLVLMVGRWQGGWGTSTPFLIERCACAWRIDSCRPPLRWARLGANHN